MSDISNSAPADAGEPSVNAEETETNDQNESADGQPHKIDANAKKQAKAAEIQYREIMHKGKPVKLTAEEYDRMANRGYGAGQAFREIAEEKKATAEMTRKNQMLIEALKSPEHREKVLEHLLGDDFDTIAEARLARQMQKTMLTPEQLEHMTMKEKLAAYEAQERQRQEHEQQAAQERSEQEAIQVLDKGIASIADKLNLPKSPQLLHQLAQIAMDLLDYEDAGIQLTEDQMLAEYRERLDGVSREREARIADGLEGDALLDWLGEKTVSKAVDALAARYQKSNPYAEPQTQQEKPSKDEPAFLTPAQFNAKFKK